MKLVIGSDKSGYTLKEALKAWLTGEGHSLTEIGTTDPGAAVPFFKVAPEAARMLQSGEVERAILICGTGMGMSQVASKFKGVRAACVESLYAARMCRAVNDSNALCLGGWIIAPEMGVELARAFIETEHTQGLEPWRQEFLLKAKAEFAALENEIFG